MWAHRPAAGPADGIRAGGLGAAPVEKLRAHNQFQGHQEMADLAYPRIQLMWPARLIPDAWMEETCALGSIDQSVTQWQRFRDTERTRSPPMAALRGRMQG